MQGRSRRTTRRSRPVHAAVAAVLAVTLAGCWPAPGQGPDRSSYNPFETVITTRTVRKLAPVWTATTDSVELGGVVGPPVVSTAGVHVSDRTALYSFDLATGARRWRFPEEPAAWFDAIADPLVDGDRLLYSFGINRGESGTWIGEDAWLDTRTGARLEQVRSVARTTGLRGRLVTGHVPEGGPAVGIYTTSVQVLDTVDPLAGWGRVVRLGFDPGPTPLLTLGAQRLYLAGTTTEVPPSPPPEQPVVDVIGVRAYSLTPPATCWTVPQIDFNLPCSLWSTPTVARPVTAPVLAPDESALYVATDDGTLLALDAADGHVLWSAALGATPSADPALAEGRLYVPLADGDLAVLAADGCGAATCDVAWRADVGGAGRQPAVAGGVVFVGTDTGRLVALRAAGCRAASCRPLWHEDLGAAVTGAPAVTNGRLYVGVAPDKVVAFAPA